LLTLPAPDFPAGAIPNEVAQEVYRQTSGQPFLLQVYGSQSGQSSERREAHGRHPRRRESRRNPCGPFFQDAYKSAPPAVQTALGNLAQSKPVDLTLPVRRWLTQRYLLAPDGRLTIPLFGAWIQHQGYIEEPGRGERLTVVKSPNG